MICSKLLDLLFGLLLLDIVKEIKLSGWCCLELEFCSKNFEVSLIYYNLRNILILFL